MFIKKIALLTFAWFFFAHSAASAASLDTAPQNQQLEPTPPAITKQEKYSDLAGQPANTVKSILQVVGGLDIDVGTLLQSETRQYQVEIKNPSEQAVKIININSNCPCANIKNFANHHIIPAGQSWTLYFDVKADLIETEIFSRKIFIVLEGYERIIIQFSGKINYFFAIDPSKKLSFGHLQDPEDAWEVTATVSGLDQWADTLVLDTRTKDEYMNLAITESSPNKYMIAITPKAVLPYTANFTYQIKIPVLKPEHSPPVILWLQGSVATNLHFGPRKIIISAADFQNTKTITKVIGCGIKDVNLTEQQSQIAQNQRVSQKIQQLQAVDWDKLLERLQWELPATLTAKKSRLKYGIQVELTIAKEAFAKQQELEIKLHRGGRYFAPIKLLYLD